MTGRKFIVTGLLLVVSVRCQQASLVAGGYFDSNLREDADRGVSSVGLKLRGNLAHGVDHRKNHFYGTILAQAHLDAIYREQSKLIVNSGAGISRALAQKLFGTVEFSHFQKSFNEAEYTYRWSQLAANLTLQPGRTWSITGDLSRRLTNFALLDSVRFNETQLALKLTNKYRRHWLIAANIALGRIDFENYHAQELVNDTSLVHGSVNQCDRLVRTGLSVRYQRRLIVGARITWEGLNSNSAAGDYRALRGRFYLSCHLPAGLLLHFYIHRVKKIYPQRYPAIVTINRDPEERIQNRVYLRLERSLTPAILFMQLGRLSNETIMNQKYYNKLQLETGVIFNL